MKSLKHKPVRALATAVALMVAGTGNAMAADFDGMTQEAKDAYRHGQIWATYATTPILDTRDIDVDVEGNTVTLTGVVETVGEKALAGLIADGADGVTTVNNQLRVDPELIVVTTITVIVDGVWVGTVVATAPTYAPMGKTKTSFSVLLPPESLIALIVDPGGDVEVILQTIKENDIRLKEIWLTHGHLDHAGGALDLKEAAEDRGGAPGRRSAWASAGPCRRS